MRFRLPLLAVAVAMVSLAGADASTFHDWRIVNLASDDTLDVRADPAGHSREQAACPSATAPPMTGLCTGGVHGPYISPM